jgi:hypothetical protein
MSPVVFFIVAFELTIFWLLIIEYFRDIYSKFLLWWLTWGPGRCWQRPARRLWVAAAAASGEGGPMWRAADDIFEVPAWGRQTTRKGRGPFMNPPTFVGTRQPCLHYIYRWGHVTDEYKPCIFVGDVVSLMNLRGWSKSTQAPYMFVSPKYKPSNINYIRHCGNWQMYFELNSSISKNLWPPTIVPLFPVVHVHFIFIDML